MTGIEAENIGRRLALHLRKNNFDACHDILNGTETVMKESKGSLAIAELPLELRTVNLLEKAGYLYVEDMRSVDFKRLVEEVTNMGKLTAAVIEEVVTKALQRIDRKKERGRRSYADS